MNKYHGRKLTLAGFKEALYQFFHNGRRLRRELLSPVLRRLREMQAALEACESYRFYSSSLLIIYDGDPPRAPARPRHRGGEEGDEDEPSDEEEEEDDDEEEEDDDEEEEGAFGFPRSSSASGSGGVAGGSSNSGSSRSSHSTGEASSPMVDVRMIDFAHTTCRHYGEDSVVHEGQDSGFIFGLQNLITIISQLEDHSTDWSCTGANMVWISSMARAHWAERLLLYGAKSLHLHGSLTLLCLDGTSDTAASRESQWGRCSLSLTCQRTGLPVPLFALFSFWDWSLLSYMVEKTLYELEVCQQTQGLL